MYGDILEIKRKEGLWVFFKIKMYFVIVGLMNKNYM